MSRRSLEALFASISGVLFGAGLVIGGMTLPSKVRGFLDFFGSWDPTLMFVMGGAVAVHLVVYRLIKSRPSPLIGGRFQLPTRKDIDARLVVGAAIFGVGWGVGGYCPGPGLVSLVSGSTSAIAFVIAMLGAIWVTHRLEAKVGRSASEVRRA